MLILRVMMGLPRSGKSTIVDELEGFQIICADDIRLAMGHQFAPDLEPFVWGTHNSMIKAQMIRGKNIVVDSTNTVFSRLETYKRLADNHGYHMELWYVDTPLSVCLKRNIGESSVPEGVITRMSGQLEVMINSDVFRELCKEIKYESC